MVAYFYCSQKDQNPYFCRGQEALWSINPNHRQFMTLTKKKTIKKDLSVGHTSYVKLNKDHTDLFFDIFKLEPPQLRTFGEKRHQQKTTHCCCPLSIQEVADIVFDHKINSTAYETPLLQMNTYWVTQLEKQLRTQFPGWRPKRSHKDSVSKGSLAHSLVYHFLFYYSK